MSQIDCFVCYNRADRTEARHFVEVLSGAGLKIWSDALIEPGTEWRAEIRAAIGDSRTAVVLIGRNGISENYQQAEIVHLEGNRQLRLFPVLWPNATLPRWMNERQYVRLDRGFRQAQARILANRPDVARLVETIRSHSKPLPSEQHPSAAASRSPSQPSFTINAPSHPNLYVLFLAANPSSTQPLALNEEVRQIEQEVRKILGNETANCFHLAHKHEVRTKDLTVHLREQSRIDVLHWSGHGSPQGDWVLMTDDGQPKLVSARAMAALLGELNPRPRLVLMNSCYSRQRAEAIAQHVDVVIGMRKAISDQAATAFASAFYQEVARGESIGKAFRWGRVAIGLEQFNEQSTPQIIALRHDPDNIFLFERKPVANGNPDPPVKPIQPPPPPEPHPVLTVPVTVIRGSRITLFDLPSWREIASDPIFNQLRTEGAGPRRRRIAIACAPDGSLSLELFLNVGFAHRP